MSITENLKKGTAELILLTLLHESDMYGYQLSQELDTRSDHLFILKEGSMYPILYRLEGKGYISCYQEKILMRRVRIYYHLEPSGEEYLNQIREEYYSINKGIANVLNYIGAVSENGKTKD